MMPRSFLVLILFCSPCLLAADEGHHHEDLTEAQLGKVHFPSSCATATQKPVERGVALLHSFWYEEAEKEFKQIVKDDPQCAIAHWGVAMSLWHQLWNWPDLGTLSMPTLATPIKNGFPSTPKQWRKLRSAIPMITKRRHSMR